MNNKKNNEKLIIGVTCLGTVLIVIGFTLMQGSVKSKESDYVSQKTELKSEISIPKDKYKIIKNEKVENKQTYIVLAKQEFTSEQILQLTNQVIKDISSKYEIYLFTDEEKANSFNYEKSNIETLVTSTGVNVEIQKHNYIENEVESIPQNYSILSIKKENETTKIELEMTETQDPKIALAHIKFLGQSIKELNKDKNIGGLSITAYNDEDKLTSWNYESSSKNTVIKKEIIEQ